MENIKIPAIDIFNRKCIRLIKGKFNSVSVFSNNPIKILLFILNNSLERLHLVDLNSAKEQHYKNLVLIKNIFFIKTFYKISMLQVGGGVRSFKKIYFLLNKGADYLIISTLIFKYKFLCFKNYKKIILALDFCGSYIFTHAWEKKVNKLLEFIKNNVRNKQIICTDIKKDGTLKGVDFKKTGEIMRILNNNRLIISGGIKNQIEVNKIKNLFKKKVFGIICGKSFYNKNIRIF